MNKNSIQQNIFKIHGNIPYSPPVIISIFWSKEYDCVPNLDNPETIHHIGWQIVFSHMCKTDRCNLLVDDVLSYKLFW